MAEGVDESCVRLFVSVDLVGSTAFKDKSESATDRVSVVPNWADTFSQFYNGFPTVFEWERDHERLPEDVRPKLVKTLGDELLLQTPIKSSLDAQKLVQFLAWSMNEYTKKNLSDTTLLLKGAAWIAGFPINNHRVRLAGGGEDFIGPSIDAGFRVAKWSTPLKLVLSVDLAILLLYGDRALDLYFDGTEVLKGVLGGRPYPIIWYGVSGKDAELHAAEMEMRSHVSKKRELLRYCEAYVSSCSVSSPRCWLIKPYLPDDAAFGTRPEWHNKLLATAGELDQRNNDSGPAE